MNMNMNINCSPALLPTMPPPTTTAAPSPTVVADDVQRQLSVSVRANPNTFLPINGPSNTVGCSSSQHLFQTSAVPMRLMPSPVEAMPYPAADTSHATRRVSASQKLKLPPGFRFVPSDIELVLDYLRKKVMNQPLPVDNIIEEDIYKSNPWDLAARHKPQEPHQWYFFTPRSRKYPKGNRPKRAAGDGYWKAAGAEKKIFVDNNIAVGVRNALVFHHGKPNRGVKTDWLMHEYVVNNAVATKSNKFNDMTLDEWVLCKIYKKITKSNNEDKTNSDDRVDDAAVEHKIIEPTNHAAAANSELVDPLPVFEDDDHTFDTDYLLEVPNFQSTGYLGDMFLINPEVHQKTEKANVVWDSW